MPGGGMMFASTMRTFHSQWQQERNIPDQANDFIRKGMDLTLWKLNPKLVTRAVLGTGAFFDWYYEKELPEVQAKYEARPYVFDIPVQGQPGPRSTASTTAPASTLSTPWCASARPRASTSC